MLCSTRVAWTIKNAIYTLRPRPGGYVLTKCERPAFSFPLDLVWNHSNAPIRESTPLSTGAPEGLPDLVNPQDPLRRRHERVAAERFGRSDRQLATRGRPELGQEPRHTQRRPVRPTTLLHTGQARKLLSPNGEGEAASIPALLPQRRRPSLPPQRRPRENQIRQGRGRQRRRQPIPRPGEDPPDRRVPAQKAGREPARDAHRALHERHPRRRNGPRQRLHGGELCVDL